MDAIQKIEAALAAINGSQTLKALAAAQYDYHEACNPAAIREVLQTLASKEAEIERLRAELSNIAFARRFDREYFANDTAFADWAISRAGHALTQPTE